MMALGAGGGLLAGLGGASAKKAGMEASLKNIAENISLVTNAVLIILLVAFLYFLFLAIKKFWMHSYSKKTKDVKNILQKLKADLIMFKNITQFADSERLSINNAIKESIKLLKRYFDSHLFHKRLGKPFCGRTSKYLNHIANNDINLEDQIGIISCWLKMF